VRYTDAAVALHLATHSVELFLKGAILLRNKQAKLSHDLDKLKGEYDTLFPETEFAWDAPFRTEYLGMDAQQLAQAKERSRKRGEIPSNIFRYPIAKEHDDWDAISAMDLRTIHQRLKKIRSDMKRLRASYSKSGLYSEWFDPM
jgi:hypothetical protein